MTRLALAAVLTVTLGALTQPRSPAADPPRPRAGTLAVGDPAPDLAADLLGQSKSVKLADLRGKPVVLIFGSCT
jgi:cytochrome oxidase Cu insertion factor (SCO1/SenC/PrrC family)